MADIRGLLEELSNAHGPTGFEGPVRAIMKRELSPLCDSLETDGIGSLIATLKGTEASPRIMLAAHMDEVGMVVKYITPEGFVKFQPVGGWLDQALINQRFIIATRTGPVIGVTGIKSIHVMPTEERQQVFKRDKMFLDIGAKNKEDAENRLGIQPGDPIAPDSRFVEMNGGELYLGKAWDDRVGLAVMVEVMSKLKEAGSPNTVYAVATAQEEVGLRGAQTSSYHVRPDIGINLESGVAGDYPGTSSDEAQERVGGGPSIFLHDSSMLPHLKLRNLCVDVARELGITVQFEVLSGYGEDGAEMQRAHSGTPTINISVPTRYLHSHNAIISRTDFDQVVDLVAAVVKRLDAETVGGLKSFD